MTKLERLQLINQFKILNLLQPNAGYEEKTLILEGGFINHYDELTTLIQDEISDDVSQFVINVLNMYRDLHFTSAKINDEKLTELVKFEGFDGTTEFDYWSYADFLLLKINRFQELKKENKFADIDSHYPTIDKYERQLEIYRSFKATNVTLSKEQILEIMEV